MPYVQHKRTYRKRYTRKRAPRTRYNKRNSIIANRALRIAKSVNRKVAGEVNKWQVIPSDFSNVVIGSYMSVGVNVTRTNPLNTITSGNPWIMPLNWIYQVGPLNVPSVTQLSVDGVVYTDIGENNKLPANITSFSARNPLWYNTIDNTIDANDFVGAELQYRMAYLYIRGIFNASVNNSTDNTDGAVRFVIVKDKQPQGGAATWFDSVSADITSPNAPASRGVFNANLIDAQLNPATTGRFKIIYDKTMRFTTINGYKPFKYFKRLNTVVRNGRRPTRVVAATSGVTSATPAPVLKNAYYLMIFSDGINFTYSEDSSTPAAGFHLFSRIGYYNN